MRAGGLIDPDGAAELLEARDPALFARRLLALAQSTVGVEEVFAFRVGEGAGPEALASSSGIVDAEARVRQYARRFHRSDPAATAWQETHPGHGFHRRVSAAAIALGDYRRLCFERPRFVEKLCFGWRRPDHALIVSFYGRRSLEDHDLMQLGALAQLAVTGLSRIAPRPAGGAPLAGEVERRLAEAYPVLTAREREVCARTLAGRTAREIGGELGLGLGTVLTYRQRAYAKLDVSKAGDLLAAVMAAR